MPKLFRRNQPRPTRSSRRHSTTRPKLRFSPTAWAKLLCLRDLGPTEVGGFGITDAGDLLHVRDIALVPQRCNEVFVAFDDTAVAEFFDIFISFSGGGFQTRGTTAIREALLTERFVAVDTGFQAAAAVIVLAAFAGE